MNVDHGQVVGQGLMKTVVTISLHQVIPNDGRWRRQEPGLLREPELGTSRLQVPGREHGGAPLACAFGFWTHFRQNHRLPPFAAPPLA